MEREFDIVIFGASGFTGKYVIREALKFLHSPSSSSSSFTNLALAGRNTKKISDALQWASPSSSDPPLPVIPADVSDPSSLSALCRRTKILLNCVGPFRLYGEPVVSACVDAGTDYLDISGEPEFMERMEAKYFDKAVENGSLVVSACGFDSIPAEMGVLFNCGMWMPGGVPVSIEAYLVLESEKGIVGNVGTLESAVLGVANVEELKKLRKSRPKPRLQIPGPPPKKGGLLDRQNPVGVWAVKLPSADATVVRRTFTTLMENPEGLAGASEDYDHIEKRKNFWSTVKPVHFGVKLGFKSLWPLLQTIWTGIMIGLCGQIEFGRKLIVRYPEIFTLGWFRKTGPMEAEVENASFKMTFVGSGYSDRSKVGGRPDTTIVTRVSGPEVGYATTPITLVQCALILLEMRKELPKGGVFTPGIVFGPTNLQDRLQRNGMSFELLSKEACRP